MTRGPYAKTAERRRTILATALEVFGESGFRGASIREIANRVGMTDTGVLHHFGGKGNLLLEVVKQKEDEDAGALDDPYLRDLVAKNGTRRSGTVRLFTTLSAEATDPEHPAHEHFVNRYETVREPSPPNVSREDSAEGRIPSTIDPAMAARLMLAVMDGLQIQWLLDPSLEMDDRLQRLHRPLLRPRAGEQPPARVPRRQRFDRMSGFAPIEAAHCRQFSGRTLLARRLVSVVLRTGRVAAASRSYCSGAGMLGDLERRRPHSLMAVRSRRTSRNYSVSVSSG
jgi:AcrR family transcriptional regulator